MRRSMAPNSRPPKRLKLVQPEAEEILDNVQGTGDQATFSSADIKVAGKLAGVELINFMCHKHLKLVFDVKKSNCYYIIGSNGSGKSALFAGINIGLGGKGRANDRGNSLQAYVKEGEKSAKIRVTLTNEGPNAIPEYGKEIIIERSITTASTYTIKTKYGDSEEIKSRRKADLDEILRRFSIELENPLSWLSQDRSRQFLQQMKPEKLYKIFMISTELESTEEIYTRIMSYIEETQAHIDAGEEKKAELRNVYEKLFQKLKSVIKVEELSKKKSRLDWLLMWALIRDTKKKIDNESSKLKKLAEKKAGFELDAATFESRKEALRVEKTSLLETVDVLRSKCSQTRERFDDLNSKLSRADRSIANAQDIKQRKKTDVQAAEREIQQTQIQLNRLIGDSNRDLAAEENDLINQKNQIIDELDSLSERTRLAEHNEHELDNIRQERLKLLQSNEFQLRQLNEKLKRVETDKQLFISARKDRMALLGQDVPRLSQLIQKNIQRFKKKPLGPIGMFVKLNYTKWANAVEFCLRKSLNNFICDSQHDRQVFEQICCENRVKTPDLITTQFVNEKVNTEKNEPPQEFATVLRVIDVENPTVYNALVDQFSLEDFLLIENDDEARKLMRQNPPPNSRQALTLNCSHVYPASSNRPYRFYSNNLAQDARFLVNETNLDKRDFVTEASKINEEILLQNDVLTKLLSEATTAKNEFLAAQRDKKLVFARKFELENKLKDLDEQNQKLQNTMNNGKVIENLKAVLDESRQLKESYLKELESSKHHLNDCNDEKQRIHLELDEAKTDLKRVDMESRRIDKNMSENEKKMEDLLESECNCAHKLKKCDSLKKRFEDAINEIQIEYAELMQNCEKEKENYLKPDELDDPPDFTKICDTESIQAKLAEYNSQIATQSTFNKTDIPTQEQLEKLRNVCKTHNTRLKRFRNYLTRFKVAVDVRREKLNMLKFALPHNLARSFKEQMFMRDYNGTLHVDHDARVISLNVETHKGHNNAISAVEEDEEETSQRGERVKCFVGEKQIANRQKRAFQDLKGLSGGERSYTTACFVMALWECVESPFRCLDEFDVFMDMLNRRVVMEMLVDLAMEHKRNQFFFFTPQGINELKSRSNIEIFNLPKVR